MGRQLCVLLVCVATLPLFCQTSSPKPQVGTITAVNVHRSVAQTHDSDALQYDVSLKVGNTIYMVLYTPPSSSDHIHEVWQDIRSTDPEPRNPTNQDRDRLVPGPRRVLQPKATAPF